MTPTPPDDPIGYHHGQGVSHTDAYLLPPLLAELAGAGFAPREWWVFDLGCGAGSMAAALTRHGSRVTGVDSSADGVWLANETHFGLELRQGSAYDDLAAVYGRFPAVVSLEVMEHVFFPRQYARCLAQLLELGGVALISTPYHGYWKNLALAATGKLDRHFTALRDYSHIKFWSIRTLTALLEEAGLTVTHVRRIGRVPALAKSMNVVARRGGAA